MHVSGCANPSLNRGKHPYEGDDFMLYCTNVLTEHNASVQQTHLLVCNRFFLTVTNEQAVISSSYMRLSNNSISNDEMAF
jgi:hypothetical protein